MYLYRQAGRGVCVCVCARTILGFDPRDWLSCFLTRAKECVGMRIEVNSLRFNTEIGYQTI